MVGFDQERRSMSQLQNENVPESSKAITRPSWPRLVLLLLVCEKVIQHAVVTSAFALDLAQLRASVAADYRWFLLAGAALTILFAVCVWGLWHRATWVSPAVAILATVDIIGEFLAQGTLLITVNVSFLVAIALLLLISLYRPERRR
jgi:hypothetical protein